MSQIQQTSMEGEPDILIHLPEAPASGTPLFAVPNFPLDCTTEICYLLRPQDLLSLARLCTYMRNFLMHKSSRHIWKQAFVNLDPVATEGRLAISTDLPPCPPDLTEPQYANLAFSEHCHGCLAVCYTAIDWDLRVRYCDTCETENTWSFDKASPRRLHYDPTADIQKFIAIRPPSFRPAFLLADFVALSAIYEKMDDQERKKYQENQNKLLVDRRIHARECRAWEAVKRAAQQAVREKLIRARLVELGYSRDLLAYCQHQLRFHPCVTQAEPLDEPAWLEIVEFMDRIRSRRMTKAQRDAESAASYREYVQRVRLARAAAPSPPPPLQSSSAQSESADEYDSDATLSEYAGSD
ncbi:hypothetical protein DFH06DRAFT_113176 [Mycena polygramma]|nr:hypothetical protein DFH06DRAFT_113176 [Mycena polygramma]